MFSSRRSSKMKWKAGLLWTICRNRESARGKGLVIARAKFACLFIFSKLTSNVSECGTFARHLLFKSVTLLTIADKSRSVMFFQGIACFFLPSQFSFSEEKLIHVSDCSVLIVFRWHRNFSYMFDFTKEEMGLHRFCLTAHTGKGKYPLQGVFFLLICLLFYSLVAYPESDIPYVPCGNASG